MATVPIDRAAMEGLLADKAAEVAREPEYRWGGEFRSYAIEDGRPLVRLAKATEEIGRGQIPPPLPEAGAAELVTLTRQFNRLGRQIRDLVDNRTTLLIGFRHHGLGNHGEHRPGRNTLKCCNHR